MGLLTLVMKILSLALPLFAVHASAHVIGGAVNTLLQESSQSRFQNLGIPSYLRFIVTARRRSIRGQTENRRLPESADENPFLRTRREATCAFPVDIDQRFRDLNTALDVNQFMMAAPEGQKDECPASEGSWWPEQPTWNLRSTCPWVYENVTTDDNVYPRVLTEAKCLCDDCIEANGSSCHALEVKVKLLRKTGCQDGQAVLEEYDWQAKVGCFCAKGAPQTVVSEQSTGGDDDDYPV